MRNQEGKIELQKKVQGRICVKNITFLTVHSSFDVYAYFIPRSQLTYLWNGPYKDI